MTTTHWMLEWAEAAGAGAAVAGGKGWNLGRLSRYGFAVPVGGVLAAEAYRRLLGQPALRERREALEDLTAEMAATPEGAARLEALAAAIRQAPLETEVMEAVAAFLAAKGLAERPVAVRSSATAEDGERTSFAGIHESVLNVTGPAAVAGAIRECYASLWTPRAVAYRRRWSLSDDEVSCAVVICAMVTAPDQPEPVAAGVAFSCEPATGRRDRVLINAAPGLGDALVSGRVSPEQITVSVEPGNLELVERTGAAPCLTDEAPLELARLSLRVHWALGAGQDPQDIEWAYDGGRFWVLQARPVTRLPHRTHPGARALPVYWSSANIKDACPLIFTPLSADWVMSSIRHIFWAPFAPCGYPMPAGMEVVRRFQGRPYLDLTAFQWALFDAAGLDPAESNRQAGGYQPEIPVDATRAMAGLPGLIRLTRRLRLFRMGLRYTREIEHDIRRARVQARQMVATTLTTMTDRELLAHGELLWRQGFAFGMRFQVGNFVTGMWLDQLLATMEKAAPGRGRAIASGLLAGSGQVPSAEHGYRLYDLVAAAAVDPEAAALLGGERPDWRALSESSPLRQALERFQAEFGHRSVYEAELANPRWNEDPSYLLEQVRVLLAAGQTTRPDEAATATRRAAEAQLQACPLVLRPVLRWLAKRARIASGQREAAKSAMAAVAEPFRYLALEVGRRMAAAGRLARPEEVFYLTWADLAAYLSGAWNGDGAAALVADRQAEQAVWERQSPPDVIEGGSGAPVSLPATKAPAGAEPALTGIPVAPGLAQGAARIIHHPSEGHLLQPGEVLVAPSTDPGWTPLFLRAAAVVMEVGGYLSHGAIVAREYGIPAVVNIPGLLARVQNGCRLTVDGQTGQVFIDPLTATDD
ncbi:MAG: PEP/pyruvate-binding domain-containing protein [Bacillota bacterium]